MPRIELSRDELDAIGIALAAGPPRPSPGRDWTAAWRAAQDKIADLPDLDDEPDEPTVTITEARLREAVGAGVHTGLRKAVDSPEGNQAWAAVRDLPDGQWDAVVDFTLECVRSLAQGPPARGDEPPAGTA